MKRTKRGQNANLQWTAAEDALIAAAIKEIPVVSKLAKKLAPELGRSASAIYGRTRVLAKQGIIELQRPIVPRGKRTSKKAEVKEENLSQIAKFSKRVVVEKDRLIIYF